MFATPVQVRKRSATVFLLFGALLTILLFRLLWVQVVNGAFYASKAENMRMRELVVEAKRGTIYDRNMHSLAVSISVDSVVANPSEVMRGEREAPGRARETAAVLAQFLEMDPEKVYGLITKENVSFVYVKRKVDPDKITNLRNYVQEKNLKMPGISYVPESKRYYEKGKLAAHVLGVTDTDARGLEGLEFIFDQQLKGIPGRLVSEYDGQNRQLPQAEHAFIRPTDGRGLVLTIDETVQYIVERELDKLERERKPKGATIIVMEVKTGRILALGNRPTFDPNDRTNFSDAARRNRAISDVYEPGSTFKIVTASAALEEGTVKNSDRFFDPGYAKVGDRRVRCWKDGGHGDQTFEEVVQNSCNPGFIAIGLNLGAEKFYRYLKAFGFGQPTGISLNGEATGILVPQANVKPIDLATMSIGQANAVTPIQLITAVSAVANGGKLMKPQLVEKVLDAQGGVLKSYAPEIIRQVISQETAQHLNLILESVVSKGTGKNAYIDGQRVGGKTGTAQKIKSGGGYMEGEYVASFVGLAPANDPVVACLVVVDAPQGEPHFGGLVAAPIFKLVMTDVLRHLGIQPQAEHQETPAAGDTVEEVIVPSVTGLSLLEAQDQLGRVRLAAATEGFGTKVVRQQPEPGEKLAISTAVILYLGDDPKAAPVIAGASAVCPDVRGKGIRQAGELLAQAGLSFEPVGSGLAHKQSVQPGQAVPRGTVVQVEFAPLPEEGP
ncbi:stage V sporulation protein D [Heliophilum fasciatum]|uniref:Stage V sporulation protein D (Sporulation-specific penicillin-binding protein) n=1 Tax=Heliophilum fasciatum TaxID=35700 RepID=A0A4R2RJ10_9FIRM|nr:stage V sporulation protein D [Heliophilum fasciatum]MCW2278851.1 stage V sporulation protein D (sporulation-specific penicillin-binding protein) [Heliophilum fasciatum]TCP62137.1 stage V sporulation protein D (sporulation-specific penicillin-binding protein) [Heliophilum fasciatum]